MKKLCTIALCLALLIMVACSDNLFGSSSPSKDDDVKSLRIEAENAFRKGNYKKSYDICEMIVKKDPSYSFGYFGMAKSGLWLHGVNPFGIFSIIKTEDDKCPFVGEDVKKQNNYFQAMKKVVPILDELYRRDTLTFLYGFHMRAKENKGWDTTFIITTIDGKTSYPNLNERLSEFRRTFCGNSPNSDCTDTISSGKRREPFPLSDREYKSNYFGGILLLSSFTKGLLGFFDTSRNGCLARRNGDDGKPGKKGVDNPGDPIKDAAEWENWGCKKGDFDYDFRISLKCPKEGGVVVETDGMLEEWLNELKEELDDYYSKVAICTENCENIELPLAIGKVNETIDNFSGDFKEVEEVIKSLGGAIGGEDGEEESENILDQIDKYKAYASFYKVGTHFDEDGDGCIDEELLDGLDNDGDGLVHENSRIAPTDPADPLYGISAMNNSMYGNNRYRDSENWEYNKPIRLPPPVMICNNPSCSELTSLPPDSLGWITVLNFTQLKYPESSMKYWTTRDLDRKLRFAQDVNCSKYTLQQRIDSIGGCWPYYNEWKFRDYCSRSRN